MRDPQEKDGKTTKATTKPTTTDIINFKERWRKLTFTVTTAAELTKHISAAARSGDCTVLFR